MQRSLHVLAVAAFVLAALALGVPSSLVAQASISGRIATVRLGGRLDMQYQHSSVDAADNDFLIRRARLQLDLEFNDFVSGTVLTDAAPGAPALADGWVTLTFSEAFRVSGGQFKRSFDLFFVTSSSDLSIIERVGAVSGHSSCTGVGSVCTYGRLTEALGFAGRDTGLKVEGASGGVAYQASLTNGTGITGPDENDGKSLSGRLSFAAAEDVVVTGQIGVHDYLDPSAETAHAVAWGGDVQMGSFRDGFLLQAGLVSGDNWRSLGPGAEPGTFMTMQAVASYYHPLAGDRVIGVEPLARVSWAEPDGDVAGDGGTLLTPGVMFYLVGKTKVGLNLDYYRPRTGGAVYSLRFGSFVYF